MKSVLPTLITIAIVFAAMMLLDSNLDHSDPWAAVAMTVNGLVGILAIYFAPTGRRT